MRKKPFVLILVCLLSASFILGACANSDGSDGTLDASLARDGVTEYQIVLPEKSSAVLRAAADELVDFFKEATGATLAVIPDSDLIFRESSRYISIGNTTVFFQTGIPVDEDLGNSGVRIVTVEKSVMLFGESDYGALYAVYDFLTLLFDFEYFGQNTYRLNKNFARVALPSINHKNVPDIEYRAAAYSLVAGDTFELYRFRQIHFYSDYFIGIETSPWHNDLFFVESQMAGHENYWVSPNNADQLCYTARGNAEEYEAMLEAMFRTLKTEIIANPQKTAVCVGIQDSSASCNCSGCNMVRTKYGGATSALCILLCNDLVKKVYAWFETKDGLPHKRDFTVSFMAYMATEDAPVVYNEKTGAYEGINGIKLDEHVRVFLAPIYMDYIRPWTDESNSSSYNNLMGWSALSDRTYLWFYDWCFLSYYAPYDNFNVMQETYRLAVKCNADWVMNEGNHYSPEGGSAWSFLKAYVNAKLQWDCNADLNTLIEDFFEYFYKDAAPYIKAVFTSFRIQSELLRQTSDTYGGIFSCQVSLYNPEYWPKNLLLTWNELFLQASKSIEKYREIDEATYMTLYKRIAIEKMSPLFMLISMYGKDTDNATLNGYRSEFKSYIDLWSISKGDRGYPLADMLSALGIK